jgi:hypothetical protein
MQLALMLTRSRRRRPGELKRRVTDVVAFDAWYEWYDDETWPWCVYTYRRNGQATGHCLTAECSKCLEVL